MRSNNLQLPSASELFEILAEESQRKACKYDFLQVYPEVLQTYREQASLIDIEIDWLDDLEKINLDSLVDEVNLVTDKLQKAVLGGQVDHESLFRVLAIGALPQPSEAIYVFGSLSDARIKRAVELYHAGFSKKLIVSGRSPHYDKKGGSEAERMSSYAIAHDIPKEAIIIEDQSITLPDNAKRTIDLLESLPWYPKSVIIVASTYIMRRAYMEWYKFTPWPIEIIPVSASESDLSDLLRENTWYKNEAGVRMLLNEYAKIIFETKVDLIRK